MNRVFNIFRKKKSYENTLLSPMTSAITEWGDLYENKKYAFGETRSLNIAAAICSELARLATIELDSEITGSERAAYLNEQYRCILGKSRIFLEYACAKGGIVLKPFVSGDKISVSVIQADSFTPVSFTPEGEINGAVFYDVIQRNGYRYTRVEEHSMKNGEYFITNTVYESRSPDEPGKPVSLCTVDEWAGLEAECRIENIKRPLFTYLKMPAANTIDSSSPLGVSAFAKATELIKDAYEQYTDLLWEFESGKRALFLDECAVRRDDEGNPSLPQKRLYRMLSTGDDALFEDWSPEIREEHILAGLDRILRSIEFNCGLAYGTLSNSQTVDKTAEEVRASKQRSYATVCDIQNALKKSLCELIEIMDIYCDIYSLAPDGDYSVSFNFDDSIICDRSAEFGEKITLLEKSVIAPWEMRSWYFNEDEKTAKKMIGEINELQKRNNLAQGKGLLQTNPV